MIFISYSRRDEAFALQFDAALIVAGVRTFLDRREILVGDNIPQKVFDGIAGATHLACVLSPHSVKSSWVQEELSAARHAQLSSQGIRVLPILIGECEIPSAIRHIQYADFRRWQDATAFRSAFVDLLRAIGVEPLFPVREDIAWYARNAEWLSRLQTNLAYASGMIETGLLISSLHPGVLPSAVRWAYSDEPSVMDELEALRDRLKQGGRSAPLPAMLDLVTELLKINYSEARRERNVAARIHEGLLSLSAIIAELRTRLDEVLLAGFQGFVAGQQAHERNEQRRTNKALVFLDERVLKSAKHQARFLGVLRRVWGGRR